MINVREGLTNQIKKLFFFFIVLQPLLDVLSYFLAERGDNLISTLLRFIFLAIVSFFGFLLSENRKAYYMVYGLIIAFWVLHAANGFRVGYKSVYSDTANYLRIVSLPIYTLAFITFLKKVDDAKELLTMAFFTCFALIVFFTVLPWAMGDRVYTYETVSIGIMGWFSVKSAQSAIIVILVPIAILFAYRSKRYFLFISTTFVCIALMYFTGTKLTFYSALLVLGVYFMLFIINLKREALKYCAPLLLLAILLIGLRDHSPMKERESLSNKAAGNYRALVDQSMKASTGDAELIEAINEGKVESYESQDPASFLARIRKTLFGVYTDKEVYGPIFASMNQRFGVYGVMEAYNYTTETTILSDSREKKLKFAKLVWLEKDALTKLFGIEYSDMLAGDEIFDLENDFPAIFYFCGYMGFALYMLFFVYFLFLVLRKLWLDKKSFLTIEMGVVGFSFLLATFAAQISANVLRRPNVTIYFALIAAFLFILTNEGFDAKSTTKRERK